MADETNLMSAITKGASVVTLEVGDRDLKNFHRRVIPDHLKLYNVTDQRSPVGHD